MAMWINIFYILAYTAITVNTENAVDVENSRKFISQIENRENFEHLVLKEFNYAGFEIPSKDEEKTIEAIKLQINGKDFITLKDLKLQKYPDLKITSLNSSLEFFSTRVAIESENLVLFGEIYVNENEKPAGNMRYKIGNFKGLGLVGLDLCNDANFVSTNYFINYKQDNAQLEPKWIEKYDKSLEYQLKTRINKLINSVFKKRLNIALAKIHATQIFGIEKSKVFEMKEKFEDFYDRVLDELLIELNKEIVNNNKTDILLPDIDAPFTYDIGLINIRGQFLASKGWLRNLATFVRRGAVSLSFESTGNLMIFGSLGLAELKLGYRDCSIKIGGVEPSANISGKIGDNEARFAILINLKTRSLNLTSFEITKLRDIGVELTGLGAFNWLASKIAVVVLKMIESDIVPFIETTIKEEIHKILGNVDTPIKYLD